MFAVLVNTATITIGVLLGLLLRRGLPDSLSTSLLRGLGLCTIVIGVSGAIHGDVLVMILAISSGLAIGELFGLEERVNAAAERLTARFTGGAGQGARLAGAFVTSCLIMNVGAMVIVGPLDAGLRGDFRMLYTKSLLDLITGIMLTATMGVGVLGSALFSLIFQGAIVLCAEGLAPLMSKTLIGELSCVGSVIILAIGFNMVGLTKFKIINYLPALLMVIPALMLVRALGLYTGN